MRLVDLDAKEPYLLDGRYSVGVLRPSFWYSKEDYKDTGRTMYFCASCGSASYRKDPYCWNCGAMMEMEE